MKYRVEVYDIDGNLLRVFENPEVVIEKGPILIADDKFIRKDTVILKCVAENAISGVEEPAGE